MNTPSFYNTRAIRSMPVPGSTGMGGYIEESRFDNPVKDVTGETTFYKVGHLSHCAFAPAISNPSTERWFIEGIELLEEEVAKIKEILADIKLAPMYLNDPLYKFTAKHMLKLPPFR